MKYGCTFYRNHKVEGNHHTDDLRSLDMTKIFVIFVTSMLENFSKLRYNVKPLIISRKICNILDFPDLEFKKYNLCKISLIQFSFILYS